MAALARRSARAGQLFGSRLRAASPLSTVAAASSQRNCGSSVSSYASEALPGIRARKEMAFAAITAVVGAAAIYLAWTSGVQQFALEDPDAVSGLSVASCLLTRAPTGRAGKDVIRPYTPVTNPDVQGYFDLVVKIYPNGKMTQHLAKLEEGNSLEVKGPIPKMAYNPNMKRKIGMVAGGSGITPMFQIIDSILSNPMDVTQISLIYANTTPDDILLKKQLDDLAQAYPNFKVHYVVSNPTNDWKGGVGFTDYDKAVKGLPSPADDTLILVCGPPGMMDAISGDKPSPEDQGQLKGILKQAGYSADQVYKF